MKRNSGQGGKGTAGTLPALVVGIGGPRPLLRVTPKLPGGAGSADVGGADMASAGAMGSAGAARGAAGTGAAGGVKRMEVLGPMGPLETVNGGEGKDGALAKQPSSRHIPGETDPK